MRLGRVHGIYRIVEGIENHEQKKIHFKSVYAVKHKNPVSVQAFDVGQESTFSDILQHWSLKSRTVLHSRAAKKAAIELAAGYRDVYLCRS